MTSPFPFQSGSVLQAQQLNDITNLPINDQTASYSLVVGDAGKRVVMDVATANTVTVDDSVFTTGDTIFVSTKDAATTITAGAGVTINSASGLVLVAHQSGQLVALSASSFLFVATSASSGGLVFLSSTTFTAATSFSFPDDTFTADFDNYFVSGSVNTLTASAASLSLRFRAAGSDITSANYQNAQNGNAADVNTFASSQANQTSARMTFLNVDNALIFGIAIYLYSPKKATRKSFTYQNSSAKLNSNVSGYIVGGGSLDVTTQCDSATFISSIASNITGTFRVYGITNS